MPQFDQYGMGVLVIAAVVVFGFAYFLFMTYFQVLVKMTLGMRDSLKSWIKKLVSDVNHASQFGGSHTSFYDEFFEEKIKASKRMNAMLKKGNKSDQSGKAEKKA